jgi:hypothetical protein
MSPTNLAARLDVQPVIHEQDERVAGFERGRGDDIDGRVPFTDEPRCGGRGSDGASDAPFY